jgi:hypothetical protein
MKFLRHPLFLLFATLLLAWGVYAASRPPPPLPATVVNEKFSADRAELLLRELYAQNQPHVSGSAQNVLLRDRIVSVLQRSGYEPQIQRRFHCNAEFASCSPVENILAVRAGEQRGSAILLTAHYDSAWAGPGVADDGAGVATLLEIAQMATLAPGFSHDLVFLFADAEEQGLIGADAFATQHDLFDAVRAVINLEARGVTGASVMFETGEKNRGIIRMLATSLKRPVANSLTYEVYRRMPNDTDFSVYRKRGLPGVNFAFAGGAALYHSRIDDLNHLDPGSLQHHGQNAWSMLQALDQRNLEKLTSSEDAVYIDLFGRKLLQYPHSSSIGVSLVLSVLVLIAIRRAFLRQIVFRQVLWTVLGVVMLVIALPACGWLLSWPLGRWVDAPPLEHPFPWGGRAALLLAAVWSIFAVLKFLAPRVSTGSVTTGCWVLFVLLGLVLANAMPGAGFLAVLPLLGFTLGLILDSLRWKKNPRLLFSSVAGFLAATYLGIYFFFQLDVVLNFNQSWIKIMPLLLPAIAVLPLLHGYVDERYPRGKFGVTLLALILAACVSQQFVPGYTPDAPRDMALMVRQDPGRQQAWLVLESVYGSPDAAYAKKHGFARVSLVGPDGEPREVLARETNLLDLPEISVTVRAIEAADKESGRQRQVMDLLIPAGVRQLVLSFPRQADLVQAKVDGQLVFAAELKSRQKRKHQRLMINHPPSGAMRIEFESNGQVTGDLLLNARFDLPAEQLEPYMADWPDDAQPAFLGPRVLQISHIKLGGI